MSQLRTLKATAEMVRWIMRRLRRRIVGEGGIVVIDGEDTVRIGLRSSGGGRALIESSGGAIVVKVRRTGGGAGTKTTRCTFTYTLYPRTADMIEPLAVDVEYVGPRAAVGTTIPAEDYSFGIATIDPISKQYVLLLCGEFPDTGGVC